MSSLLLAMGLPSNDKNSYLQTTKKTIVDIDQLRKGATGHYSKDSMDDSLIQHLAQRTVHFHLNHSHSVVVNDTFFTEAHRASFIDIAKKMNVSVNLYWFDTTKEEFLKYVSTIPESQAKEKGWLNPSYIETVFTEFDFPSIEEGFEKLKYHKK